MKLYDYVEINNPDYVHRYFQHVVELDFMRFHLRQDLEDKTIANFIRAFNETPEEFQSPPLETIEMLVQTVDDQMKVDEEQQTAKPSSSGLKLAHHI
eukprot:CAMPEP_0202964984 /NCGR_PEP_ID=MMETSP1396-20130829/9115_1 /ASSEMBLY_ACC=CAM_ASM_000872 /TAXON_ID= /ORGANISM="Pseudokeronopsis sp., Strain Brazil" /LENGTH=96 /DNA_ID=CAMNT_0049687555 /DNA_START=833 /DNA_END=1123 /DNA_ORIENTATION=-